MTTVAETALLACKKCGEPLQEDAVICIHCGCHLRSGMNAKHVLRAQKAGRAGLAVVVSALVAVVGAAVWAGIAVGMNVEIGYVAWGIGCATALPFVLLQSERNARIGLTAAGMAVAALVIGKLMIVQWGVVPQLAEELTNDPGAMVMPAMAWMHEHDRLTPEQAAVLQNDDPDAEALFQVVAAVRTQLKEMPRPERAKLGRQLAVAMVNELSMLEKVQLQCRLYDLLWFGLAVVTAWKMGRGSSKAQDAELTVA